MTRVIHYFDYKSPYAYLAQQETRELAAESGVALEWQPYTLDIPSFLGAAELDASGRDLVGARNPHQWRRVRYIYMDCRREATRRGLTIRGPRKVFDSSVAHIGFLYARDRGDARVYHDATFERFWKRELDIEDPRVVASLLEECGVAAGGFRDYLAGEGRAALEKEQAEAEAAGVFGVPSYLVEGELFWGNERLDQVRRAVAERRPG